MPVLGRFVLVISLEIRVLFEYSLEDEQVPRQ